MKIESNNLQRNLNDFQSAARERDRTVGELQVRISVEFFHTKFLSLE